MCGSMSRDDQGRPSLVGAMVDQGLIPDPRAKDRNLRSGLSKGPTGREIYADGSYNAHSGEAYQQSLKIAKGQYRSPTELKGDDNLGRKDISNEATTSGASQSGMNY